LVSYTAEIIVDYESIMSVNVMLYIGDIHIKEHAHNNDYVAK